MKVLLFASLAEAAGGPAVELAVSLPAKVAELKSALAETAPATKELLSGCFAAINHEYADDETLVTEEDEVAFIPPVSGG
ncbi:molybdopterin converting factor subunit 1 [Paenibacillus thermotolerans]|uniref:molybdopterin converting factor subunit 1 n=1 Tax=Paenibacillus thermotolerans TaxID=3027807 RepID=UPI002367AE9D|nr:MULTISPECIES: molybdopterin converting factor subunit 1 [unclassified Paenibacillus]